ncbi:MAG: hypothetical protein ACI3V4_13135 [Faecousia sp.]
MKSVLISIQPCWCEQIVAGTKTMDEYIERKALREAFENSVCQDGTGVYTVFFKRRACG